MADDPSVGQEPASAPAAPAPTPDIEKVKAELRAEFDARIGGFQTVINRLTEENRELKTASLSEDEREQLAEQERDVRIRELEAQLKLAEISQKYPQVAQTYLELISAETEEQQAEILLRLMQPAPPAEPEAAAPSEVDKNNPIPSVGEIVARMPDGTPLTGESAWEALRAMGAAPLGSR